MDGRRWSRFPWPSWRKNSDAKPDVRLVTYLPPDDETRQDTIREMLGWRPAGIFVDLPTRWLRRSSLQPIRHIRVLLLGAFLELWRQPCVGCKQKITQGLPLQEALLAIWNAGSSLAR